MLDTRIWRVARYQFEEQARQRSFLVLLFSLPLFLMMILGMDILFKHLQQSHTTLGYVDAAGLLADTSLTTVGDEVRLASFATVEEARVALEAGQIDAYYVLPAGYRDSRRAELVYLEPPPSLVWWHFANIVRLNLMAGQPGMVVDRILGGTAVTVRAAGRDLPAGGPSAGQAVPLLAAGIFAFLVLTTSSYMMEVVVEDKENRTIEVIISSIHAGQMMVGKIVGAIGIALLQLAVWVAFLVGAAWLGANVLDVGWLQNVDVNWRDTGLIVAVALPTFVCIAALMTAVGASLAETQDVQQIGPFVFMALLLPLYLFVALAGNPNGPLAIGLSLFPVTSVMTLALRSLFSEVPAWQFWLSAAISFVCAAGAVWLAGAALRAGMLSYGKRLNWRDLLGRRGARSVSA